MRAIESGGVSGSGLLGGGGIDFSNDINCARTQDYGGCAVMRPYGGLCVCACIVRRC